MKPLLHASVRSLLLAGGLCCFLHAPVTSADPVARQLDELRQQLHSLEQRVRLLEQTQQAASPREDAAAGATPAAPVTALDPARQRPGHLSEAWKGIDSGMTQADVRERLGQPAREFTIDNKSVWYYSYPGTGNGSVLFSASGLVIGTQNPPFSFW